jgi:uncharacterized protein DUF669
MADLSHLGGLNEVAQLDLDNYAENKESTFRLPAEGRYTLRVTDNFTSESFGATQKGDLSITIDPTIVGPTNEGFQLRFSRVSAKTFQRGNQAVSQVGDFLKAVGVSGVMRTNADIADLVESTAGRTFDAKLVWSAYNRQTGYEVKGMAKFPKLADGTHQSWMLDPTPGAVDENGNPHRLLARLSIDRFIPAGQ